MKRSANRPRIVVLICALMWEFCRHRCVRSSVQYVQKRLLSYKVSNWWILFTCFCLRTSPRLLCVATQQKNTGQNLEEDQSQSQNEQKVEPSSAEKILTEEKAKLEEQLKEVTVSVFWSSGCIPYKPHTLQTAYLRAFITGSRCTIWIQLSDYCLVVG